MHRVAQQCGPASLTCTALLLALPCCLGLEKMHKNGVFLQGNHLFEDAIGFS
jgi:hypothetical protein